MERFHSSEEESSADLGGQEGTGQSGEGGHGDILKALNADFERYSALVLRYNELLGKLRQISRLNGGNEHDPVFKKIFQEATDVGEQKDLIDKRFNSAFRNAPGSVKKLHHQYASGRIKAMDEALKESLKEKKTRAF